jgi:hypothetical protein
MTYCTQNSTRPTIVNLALASRGLPPANHCAADHTTRAVAPSEPSLLPIAGIIVRAFVIAALLIAAAASLDVKQSASGADSSPAVAYV